MLFLYIFFKDTHFSLSVVSSSMEEARLFGFVFLLFFFVSVRSLIGSSMILAAVSTLTLLAIMSGKGRSVCFVSSSSITLHYNTKVSSFVREENTLYRQITLCTVIIPTYLRIQERCMKELGPDGDDLYCLSLPISPSLTPQFNRCVLSDPVYADYVILSFILVGFDLV